MNGAHAARRQMVAIALLAVAVLATALLAAVTDNAADLLAVTLVGVFVACAAIVLVIWMHGRRSEHEMTRQIDELLRSRGLKR